MYKSALTLSPTAVRTLQHAALGSGVGALGGAAAGALSADEGQRGRGALRGAALGGTIGGVAAGGGSYLSSLSAGKRINGLQDDLTKMTTLNHGLTAQGSRDLAELHALKYPAAPTPAPVSAPALKPAAPPPSPKAPVAPPPLPAAQTPVPKSIAPQPVQQAQGTPVSRSVIPEGAMPTGLPLSGSAPLPIAAKRKGTVVGTPVEIPTAIKADRGVKPIPGQAPRTFEEQQRAGRLNQSPKLVTASLYKEALEPWHAAVLGGVGNAALTGGLTAASQDERDWGQIARNAGIGGAVGAVGAGGLAHATHGTGYALGNTNGYANGLAKGTFDVENILNNRLAQVPEHLRNAFSQHLGSNLIGMTP